MALSVVTARWLASCGYGKVGDHPRLDPELEAWLTKKGIKAAFQDINFAVLLLAHATISTVCATHVSHLSRRGAYSMTTA